MVGNTDRRFLTLPAVHPSEGVSPAALLHSLVAIARDVQQCYHSASFPTHRRSVREAVREVGILLQFLEAVQECGGAAILPDSAVLSLCDLHVTFQRIQQLLRDCSRRGARVWVLMRSDRVSCEFRILIRSVATALDVLPLAAINVSAEVKELVRLVAKQSWKVHMRNDPVDTLVSKEVLSMLGQFEKGITPDASRLRWVLNHLQVQSWADCDEEVLFLEEELCTALSSNGEVGEISLLSSLRGFMLYSRSVLFDVLGSRTRISSSDHKLEGELLHHLNLEEFRCPISLELMMDPVTVSTGQTYDRASIAKWLKSGNRTCPVTGEKLLSTDLVPNSTLRKLIRQFCLERNISTAEACNNGRQHFGKLVIPESTAAVGAAKMLCDFLVSKLSSGSEDERSKTVHEIRLLTKVSVQDRGYLVEAGAVPWLLDLLYSSNPSLESLQEDAMAAILNLSKHPRGRKAIMESGGLNPILIALKEGFKAEAQHNAAATIFYLSSVDEYRQKIGETPDAIPALVALLRNGSIRGKRNATVSLFGLLLFPGNHRKVLRAGVISDLVNLLSCEREDLMGDCLAVLATLAERPEGAYAILQSSAVPSLVNLLSSPSSRVAKEYCVSVLLHLCNNGGTRVVNLLNRVPSLTPALYLVLAEGSRRAAKKASSLISVLHGEQGTPAVATAHAQQERAVPVQSQATATPLRV